MRFNNPWLEGGGGPAYYDVDTPVFVFGEFRIFKQFDRCYLHTFKNVAITQRCAPDKEGVKRWASGDFSEVMDYRVEKLIKETP